MFSIPLSMKIFLLNNQDKMPSKILNIIRGKIEYEHYKYKGWKKI